MTYQQPMKSAEDVTHKVEILNPEATKNPEYQDERGFLEFLKLVKDYATALEQERTKRQAFKTWKQVNLAKIQAYKDGLNQYISEVFGERQIIFNKFFQEIDRAVDKQDNEQLGLALSAVVSLAESSPIKDILDFETVQAKLEQGSEFII